MKVTIAVSALCIVGLSRAGNADELEMRTSQDLKILCSTVSADGQTSEPFRAGLCGGYIEGVLQMFEIAPHSINNICFPEGVTKGEKIEVIKKYLNDHPEKLHEDARVTTVKSLSEAFPCSPN